MADMRVIYVTDANFQMAQKVLSCKSLRARR